MELKTVSQAISDAFEFETHLHAPTLDDACYDDQNLITAAYVHDQKSDFIADILDNMDSMTMQRWAYAMLTVADAAAIVRYAVKAACRKQLNELIEHQFNLYAASNGIFRQEDIHEPPVLVGWAGDKQ